VDDYEWDIQKAQTNWLKHGVSFADAVAVFEDEYALTIEDDHPDEQRFITLGADSFNRLVVVVYSYRGNRIRVISARKATPNERLYYQEGSL
jgi:uncharacterized protein